MSAQPSYGSIVPADRAARRWPMRETAWRTDEPCPVCQTGLVLVDTGSPVLRAECRLCGYAGPFDTADLPDGDW